MTLQEQLGRMLKDYPTMTAIVAFREGGWEYRRAIGAHPEEDNERTLREWLSKWHPEAQFLGFALH